jgi:hypothetical protein
MTLEEVGFHFFLKLKRHLKRLFGEDASILVNRPTDANS